MEGRWLHNPRYHDSYVRWWLRSNDGKPNARLHHYSQWLQDARHGPPTQRIVTGEHGESRHGRADSEQGADGRSRVPDIDHGRRLVEASGIRTLDHSSRDTFVALPTEWVPRLDLAGRGLRGR